MYPIFTSIADRYYQFELNYYFTTAYFSDFRTDTIPSCQVDRIPPVTRESVQAEMKRLHSDPAFAEYSLLIESFSNVILSQDRFLFHGAAFCWHGGAYLFTGKSGIGKTTQMGNWMSFYGNETEIINGDKPILSVNDNGFYVHPCPWTGKERWTGERTAKLKGIILLEQGKSNRIERMEIQKAVFPLFLQFLYIPDTMKNVKLVCGYLEKLLRTVPVWKLVNDGTPAAAKLAYQTLCEEAF